MEIKILGTGCVKCQRTKAVVADAVAALDLDISVTEVTDIGAIMAYGVMSTPGLVIDETVVGSGGVPTREKVIELIRQGQAASGARV